MILTFGLFASAYFTLLVLNCSGFALIRISSIILILQIIHTTMIYSYLGPDVSIELLNSSIKWDLISSIEINLLIIIALIIFQSMTKNELRGEIILILLVNLSGVIWILSSVDFITLFIAWELFNLSLYLLVSTQGSISASLKYFLLSAFSTTFLLFAIIFLYGYTGSTSFAMITMINQTTDSIPSWLELPKTLLIVSLVFKIGAAPFHNWSPDLYENLPSFTTLWMMTIPKTTILFLLHSLSFLTQWSSSVLSLIGLISLVIGSISLGSSYVLKRFLTFSSISNLGFILLSINNFNIFLFYIVIYIISVIIIFYIIIAMEVSFTSTRLCIDLAGLYKSNPVIAWTLAICFFSMAGCPPLAGFFTKLFVLIQLIDSGFVTACFVVIGSSVISVAYYISIIQLIFLNPVKSSTTGISISYPLSIFIIVMTSILILIPITDIISLFILVPSSFC